MFEVEYKGANAVVLSTKNTTAIFDPKLSIVGLKDLSVKNVVEIATEDRFAIRSEDARLVIEGPGDYEIGDFSIKGLSAVRHIDAEEAEKIATMYRVEVADISVAVLGNVSAKMNEDQLEGLGVVDILVIPIGGGGYTLDATSATTIVRQIEPKVVIPVHYSDDAIRYEVPQDSLETFTKELGAPVETMAKYKVKSAAALPAALTVVELARTA
jgi:L-ascorbate metabolism protein UlaG (beta-lactamase superfamily)